MLLYLLSGTFEDFIAANPEAVVKGDVGTEAQR